MPAQPKTPQAPSQSADELNAATDASRASHAETPVTPAPDAPPATDSTATSNGSPRRNRKERTRREGPRPEHAFLISVHAALKAGVDTDDVTAVLAYARRAEGAAAWNMLRKTLDDMTREITGEDEPDEDDAVADEDDDES